MHIPLDTVLSTQRLRLRAVATTDIELVWSASRVEGFTDGMTWEPPANREEIVANNERCLGDWEADRDYVFTIELDDTEQPIGRVGIRREDEANIYNIGFWIHPDHWNRGYATEAARAIIDFGFDKIGATSIRMGHAIWNTRSQRVIEKLGFKFLKENPDGLIKQGKPIAEYEYELHADTR